MQRQGNSTSPKVNIRVISNHVTETVKNTRKEWVVSEANRCVGDGKERRHFYLHARVEAELSPAIERLVRAGWGTEGVKMTRMRRRMGGETNAMETAEARAFHRAADHCLIPVSTTVQFITLGWVGILASARHLI
jgi:hypothetical protein